jgi:hypothetical protein
MGMDYIIVGDCPVNNQLGIDPFINMIKSRSMYNALTDVAKQQGKSINEMKFSKLIQKSDGSYEEVESNIDGLKKNFEPLLRLENKCKGCPKNLAGISGEQQTFGCVGYIHFPISKLGERILANAAELIVENNQVGKEGGLFLQYIIEHPDVTGVRIDKLRKVQIRPDMPGVDYYEWKEPMWIDLPGHRISTSQILELLITTATINPNYIKHVFEPFFLYVDLAIKRLPEPAQKLFTKDITVQELLRFGKAIGTASKFKDTGIVTMT